MRYLVFLIVASIILVVLLQVFKPKSQTPVPVSQYPIEKKISPTAVVTSDKAFSLSIKNDKLLSGNKTIDVKQGDKVVLTVTSDRDDELHIHGYEFSLALEKNVPKQLTFIADLTGAFPIEVHSTETEIVLLQVQPK